MISVIIPTYNRGHLISRAIDSVVAQKYANWELLIVDDGSTDNTQKVIKQYLDDDRIQYVKKPNSGATHTRNVGVENARGKYITFLDSDDEAYDTWLSSYKVYIDKGAKVICCGFEYYDQNGNLTETKLPKDMGKLFNNRVGKFTNGGVFLLERELFDEIGGYDDKLKSGQHSELAMRLLSVLEHRKIEIYNIYKPFIKVHVHDGAKIRRDYNAIYLGSTRTMEKHRSLFEKNSNIYYNYLSIAARCAIKTGRIEEGKALLRKAWKLKPTSLKSYARLLIGNIPVIRNKYWSKVNPK